MVDSLQLSGDGKNVALSFSLPTELFDALEQLKKLEQAQRLQLISRLRPRSSPKRRDPILVPRSASRSKAIIRTGHNPPSWRILFFSTAL